MIYTFKISNVSKFPHKKIVRVDNETFDVELTISEYFKRYRDITPIRMKNTKSYENKTRIFSKII